MVRLTAGLDRPTSGEIGVPGQANRRTAGARARLPAGRTAGRVPGPGGVARSPESGHLRAARPEEPRACRGAAGRGLPSARRRRSVSAPVSRGQRQRISISLAPRAPACSWRTNRSVPSTSPCARRSSTCSSVSPTGSG
ncbi:hypothetical protein [Amycolatopsis sp.]|uniref:hypothetical protein n=1 Tax=Amycolatopsis sp. TaxID=37632 RepID=UPI0039C85DFD